jgi:hypothetical protein
MEQKHCPSLWQIEQELDAADNASPCGETLMRRASALRKLTLIVQEQIRRIVIFPSRKWKEGMSD